MSRISHFLIGLLLFPTAVFAQVTINDLSAKSRQAIALDADIYISKKQQELCSNGNTSPSCTDGLGNPVKISSGDPDSDFTVTAISGDVGNPIVELTYKDSKIKRRRGETGFLDWKIHAVKDGEVVFIKRVKGKPDVFTTRYLVYGAQQAAAKDATKNAGDVIMRTAPMPGTPGMPQPPQQPQQQPQQPPLQPGYGAGR